MATWKTSVDNIRVECKLSDIYKYIHPPPSQPQQTYLLDVSFSMEQNYSYLLTTSSHDI